MDEAPETQPAAARLVPRRLPPAPPGTGEAPGAPPPPERGPVPPLEDCLNDLAVIRTTFETMDVFPNDEDLRQDMAAMIARFAVEDEANFQSKAAFDQGVSQKLLALLYAVYAAADPVC